MYSIFKKFWHCGLIVAVREVKQSGTISGISGVQPVDNPYDFNKKMIVGLGNTKDRYQRLKKRKSKEKFPYSKDSEIMREVNDGAVITNYSTDMPT